MRGTPSHERTRLSSGRGSQKSLLLTSLMIRGSLLFTTRQAEFWSFLVKIFIPWRWSTRPREAAASRILPFNKKRVALSNSMVLWIWLKIWSVRCSRFKLVPIRALIAFREARRLLAWLKALIWVSNWSTSLSSRMPEAAVSWGTLSGSGKKVWRTCCSSGRSRGLVKWPSTLFWG